MEQKTALITGAGKGIGKGIAMVLAESGYDLLLHYHTSRDGAQEAAEYARSMGRKAVLVTGDLTRPKEIEQLFAQVGRHTDNIRLVVSNSGLTICRPLLDITPQELDLVTQVDWRGGFLVTQAAARRMAAQASGGHIVLVTSNQAHMAYPDGAMYGSVKAALSHFTKCAAVELAPYGIRVNAVAPGYTDTGDPRMGEKESTYDAIPMRRWCTPQEIGKAVAYLDAPWCRSVTGTELIIDGGGCLTCKDNRQHP